MDTVIDDPPPARKKTTTKGAMDTKEDEEFDDDKLLNGSFKSLEEAYDALALQSAEKCNGKSVLQRQFRKIRTCAFQTRVVCATDEDARSLADCKCSYRAVIKKKRTKDDNKYYIEKEGRNLEHSEECLRNRANCPGNATAGSSHASGIDESPSGIGDEAEAEHADEANGFGRNPDFTVPTKIRKRASSACSRGFIRNPYSWDESEEKTKEMLAERENLHKARLELLKQIHEERVKQMEAEAEEANRRRDEWEAQMKELRRNMEAFTRQVIAFAKEGKEIEADAVLFMIIAILLFMLLGSLWGGYSESGVTYSWDELEEKILM